MARFRYNPRQKRDRYGRWTSGGTSSRKLTGKAAKKATGKSSLAVVPYARTSLRSQSVGVNSGMNLSKNYRISAGGYVRLERRTANAAEAKLTSVNKSLTSAVTKKLSPNPKMDKYVAAGIEKARQQVVNKALGKQYKIGGSSVRLTTSRPGTPSITIRRGESKVSTKNRLDGKAEYQRRMRNIAEGRKIANEVNKRPARRRKERRAA